MSDLSFNSRGRGRKKLWLGVAGLLGLVGAFGAAALLANIAERKAQKAQPHFRVVELNDTIEDPAVWGKNYPDHYAAYMKTAEMVPTKHGGSKMVPREPTDEDPRTFTSQSKIEEDPRIAKMWSGYAFSADFREERGHRYNFDDQRFTKRVVEFNQPGTCLNCHASTYTTMMKLGEGDLTAGFEKMNAMTWHDAAENIKHPVACIDCHNPETMQLRVTRPGLIEGLAAYKATKGVENYDVNQHATRQEMRTYVCAQCHVEYYFKGDQKRLTFPWANGIKADEIYDFYTEVEFTDWTHKLTGSKNLKAQHPEFEMYSQGIHGRSNVACADCHMPFKREGAMKISDHHVRSPLLDVNRSCQNCHKWSEAELKARAENIQDTHKQMVHRALDTLMALIDDLEVVAKAEGETERVKQAREMQRRASWYVDFVEAENSTGFHAPQEAARLLSLSIDYARQGQLLIGGTTLVSEKEIDLEEMRIPRVRAKKGEVLGVVPAAAPATAPTAAPAAHPVPLAP